MSTIRLATLSASWPNFKAMTRFADQPEKKQQHFQKYNLGAITYDVTYAKDHGRFYMDYLEQEIRKAAGMGAKLLLLPECVLTPAVIATPMTGVAVNPRRIEDAMEIYAWAEALFVERAGALAKELNMLIGASLNCARDGKLYNTGIVIDTDGKVAGRYDKVHLAPGEEEDLFTRGTSYDPIQTSIGRIGFNICYDIQFPEAMSCTVANGAQLVLHPTMGYTLPDEQPNTGQHRLRIRASDYFTPIIYSGYAVEGHSYGTPDSAIIGHSGDVLAYVPGDKPGIAVADIDLNRKRHWPGEPPTAPDKREYIRARRQPQTYGPIMTKFR